MVHAIWEETNAHYQQCLRENSTDQRYLHNPRLVFDDGNDGMTSCTALPSRGCPPEFLARRQVILEGEDDDYSSMSPNSNGQFFRDNIQDRSEQYDSHEIDSKRDNRTLICVSDGETY